jgi:fatty-acyl-CoA synthase
MTEVGQLDFVEVPTLGDLLVRARTLYPDSYALSVGAIRRTYREQYERASLVARGLAALGARPGTRVGIYMPNCAEFVDVLFGAAMLGAVVVPINNRFRRRELLHVQSDADLAVIVTSSAASDHADHPARIRQLLYDLGEDASHPAVVVVGDSESAAFIGQAEFYALSRQVSQDDLERCRADVRLRDLAAILYTSGTTAMPKGCLHSHEALVRNGIVTGRSRFILTSEDRFWDPLPMFHVSFITPLIACIDAGAEMLSMIRFDPEDALDQIETNRATWIFAAFPAVARPLIEAGSFERRSLDSVRMSMCVGHSADLRRFSAAIPSAVLLSTYGSTETAGVITYHEPGDTPEQRVTTCGKPFRGVQIAIKDLETAAYAPVGVVGEILVRGYSILDGYLNDPAATAAALDADRWLHTGDLGALDDHGHLVFHGRLKDMIKVGGENVAAAEVEALLVQHPDILVANVVGAPDARLDEVVAAFVELVPGSPVTAEDVIAFCAEHIARYKVPRYVRFVTEWPMSATKVRKDELRRRLHAELVAAAAEGPT